MNAIPTSVLDAVVACSAPVSRPLASSSNASIVLSIPRIQLPIVLDFRSSEGKEDIQKWYRQQPTTQFTSIEYRKESGLFGHEFVAAHLSNSTVCRFDRRAREDMRGHALKDEGTVSEDSAHVITSIDTESQAHFDASKVLIRIDISEGQDLQFILDVCRGIQFHPKAKLYSLLYYNCYFFSWTLVTIITRRAYKWEATTQLTYLWESVVFKSLEYIGTVRYNESPDSTLVPNSQSPTNSQQSVRSSEAQNSHTLNNPTRYYTRYVGFVKKFELFAFLGLRDFKLIFGAQKPERVRLQIAPPIGNNDIYGDMDQQFRKHPLVIRPTIIGAMLLKSQVSTMLFEEVSSILLKAWAASTSHIDSDLTRLPPKERIRWQQQVRDISQFFKTFTSQIAMDIQSILSVDLPDPIYIPPALKHDPTEPYEIELGEEDEFETDQSGINVSQGLTGIASVDLGSTPPSLQGYIRGRMVAHFEQVESYGFGNAEQLIDRAEESMIEIWVSLVGPGATKVGSQVPPRECFNKMDWSQRLQLPDSKPTSKPRRELEQPKKRKGVGLYRGSSARPHWRFERDPMPNP